MEFEYDSAKSRSNKIKHGLDFDQVQQLWEGPTLVIPTYAGSDAERFLVIGLIEGRPWSVIITERNGRTRIISARRSRLNEEELYRDYSSRR